MVVIFCPWLLTHVESIVGRVWKIQVWWISLGDCNFCTNCFNHHSESKFFSGRIMSHNTWKFSTLILHSYIESIFVIKDLSISWFIFVDSWDFPSSLSCYMIEYLNHLRRLIPNNPTKYLSASNLYLPILSLLQLNLLFWPYWRYKIVVYLISNKPS